MMIHLNHQAAWVFPKVLLDLCFWFDFNHGEDMKELNDYEKRKVRNRLLAIYRESGRITERDLLRLSALTGIHYSMIVEVHKSTHYRPLPEQKYKIYQKDRKFANR